MTNAHERFWAKVEKNAPDECWTWKGSFRAGKGYGQVGIGGKMLLAHRVSFFLTHGRWPQPCCLHRCDNRACVNPAHLFEGTIGDNNRDMVAKGRIARGERAGGAKLTTRSARIIVAEYAAGGVSQRDLARRFGVAPSTIGRVVRGENWGGAR